MFRSTSSPASALRWVPALVLFLGASAWADAVSVSLQPKGQVGVSLPNVSLHIEEPIAGFWVKLKRSDGGAVSVKGGGGPGVTRVIDLTQPVGKFQYTGELLVNFPNGESSTMPLEFEAELLDALHITVKEEDVDLQNRRLAFRLSRPAGKAKLKVLMDTGRWAFDGEIPFNGEAPGTPLEVTWPQAPGKVMRIALEGFDVNGFGRGVELNPWQIDIPHEEVHFDTGKWEIRADQRPKLEDSFRKIADAVSKYGRLADIRLYIAGHTDSQGTRESNRTLALNRARSIGSYLRSRGIRIPIYYEGFGEEALRVPTADETDEPANRRAEYIIAAGDPKMERTPFKPKWKKL